MIVNILGFRLKKKRRSLEGERMNIVEINDFRNNEIFSKMTRIRNNNSSE
jgi:hypothetical protein